MRARTFGPSIGRPISVALRAHELFCRLAARAGFGVFMAWARQAGTGWCSRGGLAWW
ncbi:hypothetical protein GCM10020216_104570 [Nonomuraea helvata]